MKEKFEEMYYFLKMNHLYSSWSQKTTLKERALELRGEVDEMIEELEKNDMDNFKKEVGDVFWDTMCLLVVAEEKGLLNLKEVLHNVNEKFKRRKPFVLEERKVSLKEENQLWEKVKEEERNEQNKTR